MWVLMFITYFMPLYQFTLFHMECIQLSENIARNFERLSGQEKERFPETPVSENNLASAVTLYIYSPRVTVDGFCYPHPSVLI